jgi:tetratricopeptide (TPR) repeat protein
MYTGDAPRRLAHLWQLPLLFCAVVLFVCAAVLFVEGRPEITLNQKLAPARAFLRDDRPDAAVESISRLLGSEKFPLEIEGQIHLALAEALDASQQQKQQGTPAVYARIMDETQIALAQGVQPSGDMHRRMGEALEALGKPVEAVAQYRQAIAMDPSRAIRLQRKVIDLQLASSDWAPAEASIDAYLAAQQIADTERAWAKSAKAQILIDRGAFVDAKGLLDEAIRLDAGEIAQAEARYRLGVCAWKLGNLAEAQKLLSAARATFKGQHSLDADAAYALGKIAVEQNDPAAAAKLFDTVISNFPQSPIAPLARIARGVCRIARGEDEQGLFDLKTATELARSTPTLREECLSALRKASAALTSKGNHRDAVELLLCEQSLDASPPASFYARLGDAYEKRADVYEQSVADATKPAEKLRRQQLARDSLAKAGDAQVAFSRALVLAKDKGHAEAMWRALGLYERASDRPAAVAALEMFVTEAADDPAVPEALLRLGRTYEQLAQPDKATSAYQRLFAYADSAQAREATVSWAALSLKHGADAKKVVQQLASVANSTVEDDASRKCLVELGTLYHRLGQFDQAAPLLEKFATKYATDGRAAEATFLAAECYRTAGQQADAQLAAAKVPPANGSAAATEAAQTIELKKSQLSAASRLYDRVRELYGAAPQPPTREIDRRFQKLTGLRRADCDFELDRFNDAVARYQAVVRDYGNDPVALAASVQMVNSYSAMGRRPEARAANEQARRILAALPPGAFDGTVSGAVSGDGADATSTPVMSKAYYEQWLRWTSTAAGAGDVANVDPAR